jgi:hypothetical protein
VLAARRLAQSLLSKALKPEDQSEESVVAYEERKFLALPSRQIRKRIRQQALQHEEQAREFVARVELSPARHSNWARRSSSSVQDGGCSPS